MNILYRFFIIKFDNVSVDFIVNFGSVLFLIYFGTCMQALEKPFPSIRVEV